jgi:hypothetical protein
MNISEVSFYAFVTCSLHTVENLRRRSLHAMEIESIRACSTSQVIICSPLRQLLIHITSRTCSTISGTPLTDDQLSHLVFLLLEGFFRQILT